MRRCWTWRAASPRPGRRQLVCTNLPGAHLAPVLEAEFGIPVFNSTSICVAACLGLISIDAATRPPSSLGQRLRVTTLLRNARVLTMDDSRPEWPRADIVVEDGRIAAIGPDAGRAAGARASRRGPAAMPGLVNAHFHSPGNLMAGWTACRSSSSCSTKCRRWRRARRCRRWLRCGRCWARWRCCGAASPPCTTTRSTCPCATRRIDRRDHAGVRDAGMRATVAIDQPNIVEYDKYRTCAELLPDAVRGRWTPRRARRATSCSRCIATDRALARRGGRPPARRGVVLGAAARHARLLRGLVGAEPRARPAVQHPHPRDQAAARAGQREVRQVAGPLRARPRLARRAHDGDPRHLGRRRRHRAAGRIRLHGRAQPRVQPAPGQRRHAVPRAARRRRADLPRHRRGDRRRLGQLWFVAKTPRCCTRWRTPE